MKPIFSIQQSIGNFVLIKENFIDKCFVFCLASQLGLPKILKKCYYFRFVSRFKLSQQLQVWIFPLRPQWKNSQLSASIPFKNQRSIFLFHLPDRPLNIKSANHEEISRFSKSNKSKTTVLIFSKDVSIDSVTSGGELGWITNYFDFFRRTLIFRKFQKMTLFCVFRYVNSKFSGTRGSNHYTKVSIESLQILLEASMGWSVISFLHQNQDSTEFPETSPIIGSPRYLNSIFCNYRFVFFLKFHNRIPNICDGVVD